MKEKCKIRCGNIDKEFLEYTELNKRELQYRMTEKFKNSLTVLNTISEKLDEMEIIRELEVEQIKEIAKKELKKATKFLADLNIEEIIQVEELLEIETRLERLKIPSPPSPHLFKKKRK